MILKKPYAFLIKHFRIIHLLLCVPILYLITSTSKIISFFKSYVANNYTTNIVQIAGEHINLFMYLAVILILLACIAIYYLMRQKRKSTKLYFFALIYYLILFVLIGVTHSILTSMEYDMISAQTARAYRDISFVICLPQYFFFIYMLIRGIGFDIKKFNFESDIKGLEIKDVDSEEFEFQFNIPRYKVERTFRRFIREFTYYVKENKFIFGCIVAFFTIFLGTTLYLHFNVYNKTYFVSDKMTHNYFTIEITDALITNLDYNGNVIADGKYFLTLQLLIENRSNGDYELDDTNFRLVLNNQNIYPTLDRGGSFIDMGVPYAGEKIRRKTKDYYVLVYEINEQDLANEYLIKILEGLDYKAGQVSSRYKNIKLNPKKIDSITEEDNLSIGKIANFKNSFLGYTTLKIDNYSLSNTYTYDYTYCYSTNNCQTLKDKITTNVSGIIEKTTLLILNGEYSVDLNTIYGSHLKLESKFLDQLLSLRYEKNGKTYIVSLENRTTNLMNNTIVFETSYDIVNADKIDLLITLRNKRYIYNLK